MDFSTFSHAVSDTPWFGPWAGAGGNENNIFGFYFKNGFFICGAKIDPKACDYTELGSGVWRAMPRTIQFRRRPGHIAWGETAMWVLGGIDEQGDELSSTEIFFNGKWKRGPEMPASSQSGAPTAARSEVCVARLTQLEFIVFGGVVNGYGAQKTTFIYNVKTEKWTEMPLSDRAKNGQACASYTLINGTTLAFKVMQSPTGNDLEVFSSETRIWTYLNELPASVPPFRGAKLSNVKGKLFLIGGDANIRQYDEDLDTWNDVADMQTTVKDALVIPYNL